MAKTEGSKGKILSLESHYGPWRVWCSTGRHQKASFQLRTESGTSPRSVRGQDSHWEKAGRRLFKQLLFSSGSTNLRFFYLITAHFSWSTVLETHQSCWFELHSKREHRLALPPCSSWFRVWSHPPHQPFKGHRNSAPLSETICECATTGEERESN